MKILLINSRFFLSAGPEKYMFGLIKLLEKHGHEVIPFSTHNPKNVKTKYEKYFVEPIGGKGKVYFEEYEKDPKTSLQVLDRQFYSVYVRNQLDKLIQKTKPDIAYILHHQNKLSPSVIDACKKNNLPVVLRMSDFSVICPANHLLRGEDICEECIKHSLMQSVKHKCVKNSYTASLIKALALTFQRKIKIYDKVDKIIVPSRHTLTKLKSLFPENKLVHLPTFVLKTEKYSPYVGDYALFVGRIEKEKGLIYAIKAFAPTPFKLKIVGKSHSGYDKVLKEYVLKNDLRNIEFIGPKFGNELRKLYKKCRFVILPVIWYENLPNVALEAMIFSKPILATNVGSMKEIVNDNGLLFKLKDICELQRQLTRLFKDTKFCQALGKNSYKKAVTTYNPEVHYNCLIRLFNEVRK